MCKGPACFLSRRRFFSQRFLHTVYSAWRCKIGRRQDSVGSALTHSFGLIFFTNTAQASYVILTKYFTLFTSPEVLPNLPKPRLFKATRPTKIRSVNAFRKNTVSHLQGGASGSCCAFLTVFRYVRSYYYPFTFKLGSSPRCMNPRVEERALYRHGSDRQRESCIVG